MAEPETWRFAAFLSYKHVVSGPFARDFELHLKTWARGRFTRPPRIFRDEQHIRPGESLPDAIHAALRGSKFLVLLASPEAAASVWVDDELRSWCAMGRADRLVIVLTAGTIAITPDAAAIDWARTDALPRWLAAFLPPLPTWVDATWASTPGARSLDDTRYRRAVNAVTAAIREVDPNVLMGQEWKLRRRDLLVATGGVGVLATLLVLLAVGAFQLAAKRDELAATLRTARSRELAATARLQDPEDALATAARSRGEAPTLESTRTLLDLLGRYRALRGHVLDAGGSIGAVAAVPGGFFVVAEEQLVEARGRRPLALRSVPGGARDVVAVPGGPVVGLGAEGVWTLEGTGARALATLELPVAIAAVHDAAVVALARGQVASIDLPSGVVHPVHTHDGMPTGVAISDEWIASSGLSREPVLLTHRATQATRALPAAPFSANGVALREDALAVAFENGEVGIWDLPALTPRWTEALPGSAARAAFSPDGRRVAFSNDRGDVRVFTVEDGDAVDAFAVGPGGVWALEWVGASLYTGGSDGWLRRWEPGAPGPLATEVAVPETDAAAAAGGRLQGIGPAGWWTRGPDGSLEAAAEPFDEVVAAAPAAGVAVTRRGDTLLLARRGAAPVPLDLGGRVREIVVSEGGAYVAASLAGDGQVVLVDVATGIPTPLPDAPRHADVLAFRGDAHLLVLGADGRASGWSLPGLTPVEQALDLGVPNPTAAAPLADGWLVAGLMGELVRIPSAGAAMRVKSHLGGIQLLRDLGDRGVLVSCDDGLVWLDAALAPVGTLLDDGEGPRIRGVDVGDGALTVVWGRRVLTVPLDLDRWAEQARVRARP